MSTLVNCNVKISELIYVLKKETKLLSKGRIDGLEDIVLEKQQRMDELEVLTEKLDTRQNFIHIAPQMEKLKRLADENGIILKSVLNGLRSARERLQALQHQEAKVGAYNRSGNKLFISEDQVFSEKRV
jgi:flagellar biosynthesis/type III secretory pathway chaperone